ncbi:Ppx/GppA family phosphatase [Rhodobacteraceae bacterium RKSG542]|uniref:Ppx/GppA phosphatase family protein n=1 Tax=Pseudovibrio flavus TaxID=2529854 RepID=UPI0012BCC275|nr:Ppx/GppA phosphatase family protein [Pseudovibrio flavus]MTI16707.1 Ppx/GppA family phosphatase [Pseudovibrio flavus]
MSVASGQKALEAGNARPEGAKRQKKSRRNKPNRAERRALARQSTSKPVVEIRQGGTAVDVQFPAAPKPAAEERSAVAGSPAKSYPAKLKGNTPKRHADGDYLAKAQEGFDASAKVARRNVHGRPAFEEVQDEGGFVRGEKWPAVQRNRDPRARRGPLQRRDRAPEQTQLYAALDLGTNNCRLLIARPEQRGFRVIDAYSRIVRLGEGIGKTGRLSDAAMGRAIEALKVCRAKLEERGVQRQRLIATEACRAAENGREFIEMVKKQAGLSLEIVSQESEARLAVAGCVSLVDPKAEGVLLFDIGGGSSEIVWLDLRNRYGARGYALTRFVRTWISLPVGVVNLAERHGGKNVSSAVFEDMVQDVARELDAFPMANELAQAMQSGNVHMLGTSGTVTTIAGVHLGLKRYDRRRVDGAWLQDSDVHEMIQKMLAMSYQERVENPCIGEDRADLVLAGCAILEAIRRRWPCERLRVADRGLREGILMEMMAADKVWRSPASRKWRDAGKENK